MRRSLRFRPEEPEVIPSASPVWINVKLRPTGMKLIDDPDQPEVPQVPQIPQVPQVTKIPKVPQVPQVSKIPKVPKLPELPKVPQVPKIPKVMELLKVPQVPELPKVPEVPELQHYKSVQLMKMLDETRPRSLPVAEDSTEDSTEELIRRPKKVVFDKDVKEESDRMSRPRRIRTRSPESRLRQWQSKLESTKSSLAETPEACGARALPLTRFGDAVPTPQPVAAESSEMFRSLLQNRKPSGALPEVLVEVASSKKIVNGIINFDCSVERKIVVLESEQNGPPPKSILKKRSIENLLDEHPHPTSM